MKQVGNKVTFYIRDAQGNVMGLYDATRDPAAGTQAGYTWQEQHLYGSSRLGMFTPRDYIANGQVGTAPPSTADPAGGRIYELSNHLGNVHVTISDILRQEAEDGKFVPEIVSTSDYYPFGMLMPERHGFKYGEGWAGGTDDVNGNSVPQKLSVHERSTNTVTEYKASKEIEFLPGFGDETLLSDEFVAYIADETNTTAGNPKGSGGENNGYRYGFGGQEMDAEIYGQGNAYTAEFWEYDPRSGRRWNVDPLTNKYPWQSPFASFDDNPIAKTDPLGLSTNSTDVKRNKDGTYTVVNAINDNDNNVYVVDENNKRTKEVIATTIKPFDFVTTNDKTGGWYFDKNVSGVTFDLNKLTVSGTVHPNKHTTASINNADAARLIDWGQQLYNNEVERRSPSTFYGKLEILKEMSANGAALDFKVSLGLNKYDAIKVGTGLDGKPVITTLRAVGNIAFGANLRSAKPYVLTENFFYKKTMQQVGAYNQSQNKATGYNAGAPFYGEHTYSGSYIYLGYFKNFP